MMVTIGSVTAVFAGTAMGAAIKLIAELRAVRKARHEVEDLIHRSYGAGMAIDGRSPEEILRRNVRVLGRAGQMAAEGVFRIRPAGLAFSGVFLMHARRRERWLERALALAVAGATSIALVRWW
jgi:hypothetical protein